MEESERPPTDMSEQKTRLELIDPALQSVGWFDNYIKEEVNSVKSDFVNKQYVLRQGRVERGVDRFIDYLLLDEDYSVLALIEAKKFSKDEHRGRVQARSYAKDIESQIGRKIPIFLSNGLKWVFIDEFGVERAVSGPFSQGDLRRRASLFAHYRNPCEVFIRNSIVDRPKSVSIVRKLCEHFSEGHRKALVHMATGTGKTRVAMAIIDVLINANVVRNVLFVADRISLVNQAQSSGFQQFFTEPVVDLRSGFSKTGRLYVSTVQSLMSGGPKRLVDRFSPGFFDLIIFDEAHRSIYDKNNYVSKYFDAIEIGLTATPRRHESRNTYDLFSCIGGAPTVEYSYDEAVLDHILVPYRAEIISTERLSLGIVGSDLSEKLKDELRRQEINPEEAKFSGAQFDRVFMDDKVNELIVAEFMQSCYKSDEGKPCKSIFFCASQRHARHLKAVFDRVVPKLSSDVQIITSEMYRAEDEVKRFQLESEPRIALSVGMLDTGVDVPEICNLVFVKPVFSSVRFWQMIGRGTRNENSCKHPQWLPNRQKKDFLILDFTIGGHSNVRFHEFVETKERSSSKDVMTRIFENRVRLLEEYLDENQRQLISDKIIGSLDDLDSDSFLVREKLPLLSRIKGDVFHLDEYVNELLSEISPLMMFLEGGNVNVSSFILQVEKLFSYVSKKDFEKISSVRVYVTEMCENILQRDNLSEISEHRGEITQVLRDDFWEDITFQDVEFLVLVIAPLMKYYEPNPKKIIQIDAPDVVMVRERFEKEVCQDEELTAFIQNNALVKKIRDGEGITSHELLELELQLSSLKPGLTIENVQRYQKIDFLLFLRDIIGLSYEYDPKELIERRFDEYILNNTHFSSRQLAFLVLLKKVFSERKRIEITDLAHPPLSEEHPLDYFQIEELQEIIKKCNQIQMK